MQWPIPGIERQQDPLSNFPTLHKCSTHEPLRRLWLLLPTFSLLTRPRRGINPHQLLVYIPHAQEV